MWQISNLVALCVGGYIYANGMMVPIGDPVVTTQLPDGEALNEHLLAKLQPAECRL
jgi:hypothetical protein